MKKNHLENGFTLIELLVVIAIIGILSSIVMGQLTSGRQRAANAAIKASLSNLRTQATLVYDTADPDSYADVCTDVKFVDTLTHVGTLGEVPAECFDAAEAWVVKATLNVAEDTSTNWCSDSTGRSEGITEAQYTAITSATTLCP